MLDKIHEECGVLGICDLDGSDVAKMLYYGLFALQHRGQGSCGIAVNDDGKIKQIKDKGLMSEVFNDIAQLDYLSGNIGVGHVRYAKKDDALRENAQPLVSRYIKGSLTLALNGSIINAPTLRADLESKGAIFQSDNDAEVLMHLFAIARTTTPSIEDSVLEILPKLHGAYSFVLMSPRKLIGVRDPRGIRPLCIGRKGNTYILASESVALDVMQAEFVRDVEPGEIVVVSGGKLHSIRKFCGKSASLCIFEYVYFARPDSIIDGVSVYSARYQTGRLLARVAPIAADMVIGVPDSGLNFAQGYATESGIPYGEGLIRNRYTGRTFIKQTQSEREIAVSIKLNVLRSNVVGKRIVMVDDSIVRGTTSANIIKLLKDNGAREVHLRIASPIFLYPCYYGTDIPSRDALIAVKYDLETVRQKIGADSLAYLPLEALDNIGLRKDFGYCRACFTGQYPIWVPEEQ